MIRKGLDPYESQTLYFLTDTKKIVLGQQLYPSKTLFDYRGHVNSVDDLPQDVTDSELRQSEVYSVGDSYGLYVYDFGANKWIELSKIPDGSISFSQLGDFIDQVLSSGKDKVPTSKAVQDYVNKKVKEILDTKSQPNGIASLDSNGKVPLSQLQFDNELSDTSENAVQNKVLKGVLDNKVDKEGSKKLSTHDLTDELYNKLFALQVDGGVVQSDWKDTNPSSASFIKNKPNLPLDSSGKLIVEDSYDDGSSNPISGKGVSDALSKFADGLITVDDSLSQTSTNPIENRVITEALGGKVSSEQGKGLSTNDFTDEYKTQLDNLREITFTQQDREKLNSIEEGAQVNVQPDWNSGEETFLLFDTSHTFTLKEIPSSNSFKVTVNGIEVSDVTFNQDENTVTIGSSVVLEVGDTVVINYVTPATILNKPTDITSQSIDDGTVGT